ncbi:hypothetical protein NEPAR06_1721 [Nematocida parisii]|uniref:RFX-type winged-helix domain-containing protein n=1 Tax=Nematocida parisii (strain ERTm3) TaxID=935791 RepID=I3EHI6_NEMP3|nr:hypothetical protein NEQG_01373 [Nematocida parisii ERTm3]KAI5126977.1 hypothetical protein NEPAR03_0725 [Nematocida parisii]KAI5129807.1 hypothetical protein NEPAR08_1722 [Nematocida parisii]KAI5140838.1 hypothetical protein NEPAR04_0555 [Nematocida parisii]KAI5143784.1 hypothetical protein NEPAR07_0858 [Nematocida parisii]
MFIESMNQPITNWLNLNYVPCKDNSIPRCIIYQHYCNDFKEKGIEPLNTAMFGKVIKMAFPFIRSRRLGNRGNSKYHYFGVAAKGSSALSCDKETQSEKLFVKKYGEMHRAALEFFLDYNYMKGYQEMKYFWSENAMNFTSSRYIERICSLIEREFFGMILSKVITTDSILDLTRELLPENILFLKTTAKTINLMCQQMSPLINSRGMLLRIDCYKQCAAALNSIGNIQKYLNVLRAKYSVRKDLQECRNFLSIGMCISHESISLDRSSTLHNCASALISLFISSSTFDEFLEGVDSHVTGILYRKEKIPQDLVTLYFSGIQQECIVAGIPCIEFISVLLNFFSEHFTLVNSGLSEISLKKKEVSSPSVVSDITTEEKSFVSQIIKQD